MLVFFHIGKLDNKRSSVNTIDQNHITDICQATDTAADTLKLQHMSST